MRASRSLPCDRQLGIRSVLIVLASGMTFACGKGSSDGDGRVVSDDGADAAFTSSTPPRDDASPPDATTDVPKDDTAPGEPSPSDGHSNEQDARAPEPTAQPSRPSDPASSDPSDSTSEPPTDDAATSSSTQPDSSSAASATSSDGLPPPDSSVPACNPNDSLECPCPAGQLRCYGVCVDPLVDANYCGATDGCELTSTLGTACQPLNAVCEAGHCAVCSGSSVACANTCIAPAVDQTYCGAAAGCSPEEGTRGDRCRNPELCLEGACVECVAFTGRSAQLPEHAEQLALGDVDGDTLPDVVTATGEGQALLVILGSDSGDVGQQLTQPIGENPHAVGLGLLDVDAELDVLVGDYATKQVHVGRGAGDGSFEFSESYEVLGAPRQIVLGDVDGNETLDAFVLSADTAQLELLLGAGDGTFSAAAPIPTANTIYALALGDLNGDSALDGVAVGLAGAATVLLNDGDGGFTVTEHPIEGTSHAVVLADLNGDEQLDLVTGHSAGYNINVSIGNGDGTFATAHRLNVSESTQAYDAIVNALAVADFDGDDQLDVAVAMNRGISVMWGHQNWAADQRWSLVTGGEFIGLVAGDYNRDGVQDLIAALYNTNSDFRVFFGGIPEACPPLEAR